MKVGLSQLVVPELPMAEFFAQAKAAGYEVLELALRRADAAATSPDDLTLATAERDLERVAADAKSAGLELVSMTHSQCTGNLLAGGELAARSIEETRAGLASAARMGIRTTLHTLGRLSTEICYDQSYASAIEALRTLAPDCERLDVAIAVEFVWNGFAFSPLEMKRLLDEVASPHIGFYFDPGNMAVYHFPHHWVKILGRHTKMVHLKDWEGGPLNGRWSALLSGTIDFTAVMRELRAIGYDGPLISEVPPNVASLSDTAAAIRTIMAM